jgi:hypothetical protein
LALTTPRLLNGVYTREFFVLVFLLASSSSSGESDAQGPPSGNLPRLIWECEAGPGFSSCSVWIWHGSSYSAIWSNGEIGRLTVQSGSAAELTVLRTDTAGNFTGLTATYTGKWDGTSIANGKLTFNIKGTSVSGAWTGKPEVTPVIHTAFGTTATVTSDELYGVGNKPAPYYNWYTAELTGFAIHSLGRGGSGISTAIDDFRALGVPPMKSGERRLIANWPRTLRPSYDDGATYRPGSAIAAIFADGTTFGDRQVLSAMIDYRRAMIGALTAIGTTLCTLGDQQPSIVDVQAMLDKQHAAEDARSASDRDARAAAYAYVGKSLDRANRRLPASEIIKQAGSRLNQLRSALAADPVRNVSGQLAISAPPPLACSL